MAGRDWVVNALGTALAATLLSQTALASTVCLDLSTLLNGVLHHLLLLEALPDVVAVQLEVALLAKSKQYLREEAASDNRSNRQNNEQVWALLNPASCRVIFQFFLCHMDLTEKQIWRFESLDGAAAGGLRHKWLRVHLGLNSAMSGSIF